MSSRTLNEIAPAFVSRPREELKVIARETLAAVKRGSYTDDAQQTHQLPDLSTVAGSTIYFDAEASGTTQQTTARETPTEWVLYQASTLQGIRFCLQNAEKLAILNFASATSPGGGFLGGARAQEETLARSSNLYSSLTSATGKPFYSAHNTKSDPRFSHAMLYTKNVRFVRNDAGSWLAPADVDVLTCAAVNVNALRKTLGIRGREDSPLPEDVKEEVSTIMRERMARILSVFARNGATDIVLGSFGTGAFRNSVEFVARTWAELLFGPFKDVFRRVVFAIIDEGSWRMFADVFREVGVQFIEEKAEPI
ncbi:DUF2263 domain-containing protein [Mycena kentingensis (nom. inval.)]|nr:DUF2263 domain-containing protein [Mycena kentingensis (nom. inval.)]